MYSKETLLAQINGTLNASGNPLEATENVINAWEEAKQVKLLSLLKDQLVIEKEVSFDMPREDIVNLIKESGFIEKLKSSMTKEYFNESDSIKFSHPELDDDYSKLSLIRALTSPWELSGQKLGMDYTIETPFKGYKQTKFQKGTKVTRIWKQLIPEEDRYSEIVSEYSKFFNQQKIKGTLCLSIHPVDYLTASTNGCGWRSCFNLLDGEYKASLGGLIGSQNTMIAYLKSSEDFDISKVCYGDESFLWNSKKWRTYVTLNHNNALHIGCHYPYSNLELEKEIVSMIEELTEKKFDLFKGDTYLHFKTVCDEGFYNDGVQSIYLSQPFVEKSLKESIHITDGIVCLHCGEEYSCYSSDTLYCEDCWDSSIASCQACGCSIYENDEYIFTEDTDNYFCSWCGDSHTTYCNSCCCYLEDSGTTEIENCGWDENWCAYCFNRAFNRGEIEEIKDENGNISYKIID